MSLFGSFMGDFDDDPIFGSQVRHMRQMNAMMNQMFSAGPFGGLLGSMGGMGGMGGMGFPALTAPHSMRGEQDLMPYGAFPSINMNRMFQGLGEMSNSPNCHSYSSSSVMTMSSGPDGQPQVYQASASTRTGPGGIKETKKTVCDSRSGVKKMAIGHHIGERAHVLEREQDLRSGNQEERHEFINLEEEEADEFNQEFERKARYSANALDYSPHHSSGRRQREPQLALPGCSRPRQPASPQQPSVQSQTSRKRDHEPDVQRQHKSRKPSQHQSIPK